MDSKDTSFKKNMILKCGDKDLDLSTPVVMGILNITPDSFYDGGNYTEQEKIIAQTGRMLSEGASIIDIGAYSSKPGSNLVSQEEELKRLRPVFELLKKEYPDALFSIDTYRSEVVKEIIKRYGACFINDISGGSLDKNMYDVVAEYKLPYVLMHMQGNPQTMQNKPTYIDVTSEVLIFFQKSIERLNKLGLEDIIIDPGFGFGKTLEHNYKLLHDLQIFNELNRPLMAGVSRKSMITKLLDIKPEESLNGTTALNTLALLKGAKILRVHDVKEAMESIKIVNKMLENKDI